MKWPLWEHNWSFISAIVGKITNTEPLVTIRIDWYTRLLPTFVPIIAQTSHLCLLISITTLTCQSLALTQNCLLMTLRMVFTSFIFGLMAYVVANSHFAERVRNLVSTIGSADGLNCSVSKSIILSVSSWAWPKLSPITGRISRPVLFG